MSERERPILFSGPMVRAILDGRKTQTRRVAKVTSAHCNPGRITPIGCHVPRTPKEHVSYCPYGVPGDLLWVRETWRYADWTEDGEPFIQYCADGSYRLCKNIPYDWGVKLEDIWATLSMPENYAIDQRAGDRCWRPSIHMPRWASRLTLRITDVRVQRVQEISEDDAIAEGVYGDETEHDQPLPSMCFKALWDSINAKRGYSWDANPCVWVVTFERVKP